MVAEVNRAFSAGGSVHFTNPRVLPSASDETGPLALNTYASKAVCSDMKTLSYAV